jgi:putative transposase
MPRAPRYVPPDSMVEITSRTVGGALLFRPLPALNAAILSIVVRAFVLYPLQLHAIVFLSNHWHALTTVAHAEQLAAFMRYVNGNLAKVVKDMFDWKGNVWEGRPRVISVVDDDAAERRFAYILAHGTKEGLVASPLDWPGVSSARALALGEPMIGRWRNRAKERRRHRRGTASDVVVSYEIALAPLPSWSHLSSDERRRRVQEIVESIVEQHQDRPHAGVAAVNEASPFSTPQGFMPRQPPPVHATGEEAVQQFLEARAAFLQAYYAARASTQQPALDLASRYPPGAIPPRPPMSPRPPLKRATVPERSRAVG